MNVIKMSDIMGTKYASKLKETKQILRMFNSTIFKPLGNCTIQLRNAATQAKYKVGFTVIGCDEYANLIGSRAAQLMGLVDVNKQQTNKKETKLKSVQCPQGVAGL